MTTESQHPAVLDANRLLADCDIQRSRRSGPGGQHRNKVETAVTILHRPTGVAGEATERRSQAENRARAIHRLRINLALEVRTAFDDAARPTQLWQSRVRGGKIAVNPSHADFPALLAESLDYVAAHQFDLKAAAERLACSTTQLVKFLKAEPRALAQVNEEREERGLRALK